MQGILRVLSEIANRLNGTWTPTTNIAQTNRLSPHDYRLVQSPTLQ